MKEGKIYTKSGDKGETALLGGRRVPKFHLKVEAYGTADELNVYIGMLRDQDISSHEKEILLKIQERVFVAEALLARDEGAEGFKLPVLEENDICSLEKEIDAMNALLPVLGNFILPGGHPAVSSAHLCRVVCRRAERIIIYLSTVSPVDEIIIRYFNRLSDYFFVLARKLAHDKGVGDVLWEPVK